MSPYDDIRLRMMIQIYSRLWVSIPIANMLGTTLFARMRDSSYKVNATQALSHIVITKSSDSTHTVIME